VGRSLHRRLHAQVSCAQQLTFSSTSLTV
jgi:hypothetical protein